MSNIENRTVYCNDNLNILKGINNESVDLIYLDPPFNSGRDYTAPRKSMAAQAEFKDSWDESDLNVEWWFEIKKKNPKLYSYLSTVDDFGSEDKQAYLVMMAIRVLEMHRVLKPTGSIWYHCDHSMSHYIKIMLDIIFGDNCFKNHVLWCYETSGKSKSKFPKKHDDLFFYTKNKKGHTFNSPMVPIKHEGKRYNKTDENGKKYYMRSGKYKVIFNPLKQMLNWWIDLPALTNNAKETTGYPTQKPLSLLRRIIETSSNEGDIVLDPFCGCATACVASEQLNRQWIGIDVWEGAHDLINKRLGYESDLFTQKMVEIHKLSKPPKRTDNDPKLIVKKKIRRVTDEVKETAWERDGGACVHCAMEGIVNKENLQYDHVIPFSLGGNNEIGNIQILCRDHNLKKSNKSHS